MLDIKFVRENPDAVKENIKKKFQDAKLPLVDEVIEKDAKYRAALKEVEALKAARNKLSKANGPLFGQLKKCTDEAQKAELQAQIDANNAAVKADADKMAELEKEEETLSARIQEIMYTIPQMIDPSVPIGPDDTYNVEAQRFGEPVVPDFPIPYHTEIMESFDGIDLGRFQTPSLTTLAVDARDFGEKAFELLYASMTQETTSFYSSKLKLIQGESTAQRR